MKIGIVVSTPEVAWGPLALLSGSFEDKVEKAARLGCDGLELMVRDPSKLDWKAIGTMIEEAGLEVPQLVTGELFGTDGLCLVTSDGEVAERAMARLKKVIDFAAHFGAMVNIGRLRGQLSWLDKVDDPWAYGVERLREVADYAAPRAVRITLEPLNRYESDFIFNAQDGVQFVEAVGRDNLGLMLDLFHMNIEDASILDSLRHAQHHLWHVHVADSNRWPLGKGHLDFQAIFSTLKEVGYEGYLSAEHLPLPDPDSAAEESVRFLRQFIC